MILIQLRPFKGIFLNQKYDLKNGFPTEPKLVLLYPSNPNFQKPIDNFIYEGELILNVIPFDLKNVLSRNDEQKELKKVMMKLNNSLVN